MFSWILNSRLIVWSPRQLRDKHQTKIVWSPRPLREKTPDDNEDEDEDCLKPKGIRQETQNTAILPRPASRTYGQQWASHPPRPFSDLAQGCRLPILLVQDRLVPICLMQIRSRIPALHKDCMNLYGLPLGTPTNLPIRARLSSPCVYEPPLLDWRHYLVSDQTLVWE